MDGGSAASDVEQFVDSTCEVSGQRFNELVRLSCCDGAFDLADERDENVSNCGLPPFTEMLKGDW